jgi:hypothetical protein
MISLDYYHEIIANVLGYLVQQDTWFSSIHIVTMLLKKFFSSLPEPLLASTKQLMAT